jgi:ubiquinone biosynthesis protein UbiJ
MSDARSAPMRPIITRLISEVTRLAEDNSAQAKAARLRLIVDDLTEIGDRLAAVEKRLDHLESRK